MKVHVYRKNSLTIGEPRATTDTRGDVQEILVDVEWRRRIRFMGRVSSLFLFLKELHVREAPG